MARVIFFSNNIAVDPAMSSRQSAATRGLKNIVK